MKKKIVLMFAAFVIGTAGFSNNYTIDIAVGFPLGFSNFTPKTDPGNLEIKYTDIAFGMKLQTYSCFLFNGMFGVYASAGFGIGFGLQTEKQEEVMLSDGGFEMSGDFMLGPAFSISIGQLRFQTGLAFHAVIANMDSFLYKGSSKDYHAFGFALTPQVRLTTDKRFSFVAGMDFIFDFPQTISNTDSYGNKTNAEYKSGFRFGCTPYLGFGVNFGN